MTQATPITRCYDFPEIVVHRLDCPRYQGGVCRPMPTPVEPYTEEERLAVEAYDAFVHQDGGKLRLTRVYPTGSTILPPPDGRA